MTGNTATAAETDATATADATGAPAAVDTTVAGLTMHARRKGAGDAVVVVHHSFGNPGWMPLHEDLAADHAVWVPDLPGFGASQRPDWARHPRDLAILLGHWLRANGIERPTLVGCGFGGWVGAELATMRPDHLGRLVLVGAAGLLPRQGRILDQVLIAHGEYVRAAFADPAAYERVFGTEYTDELLVAWDTHREMIARISWKPYMYNRQMAALLGEVRVPALVVWGERDAVVPLDCAHQYVERLPDARLELVDGCGHAVDLERPDALAALVRGFTR